jgi:uncharacterized membrane protein YraQ (UPF0718 family)
MVNQTQEVATLFLGLIIEAFPFIVLGVIISVIIARYLKEEKVLHYLPKNRYISHLVVAFFGVLIPVCECGNVPVARRLILKKFSVSQATTFLLSAPIVNPITFITTLEAFNIDKNIAIIRIVAGYLIAVGIGLLFSFKKGQNEFLEKSFYAETCTVTEHIHTKETNPWLNLFLKEFTSVFKMLFIGAFIAALMQVLIPREVLYTLGTHPVLSVLAMLLLGFIVSMCSNVDAFFALAYSTSFTLGSLLTFMIFGPMIDIKILTMLRKTFTKKFLLYLTIIVAISSAAVGIGVNIWYRNFL